MDGDEELTGVTVVGFLNYSCRYILTVYSLWEWNKVMPWGRKTYPPHGSLDSCFLFIHSLKELWIR